MTGALIDYVVSAGPWLLGVLVVTWLFWWLVGPDFLADPVEDCEATAVPAMPREDPDPEAPRAAFAWDFDQEDS